IRQTRSVSLRARSLWTHRTNMATANRLSANPLWVTQTSHDLHPENRGQTETQSGYPRSPPHRPSGTLLRWEAQFRRGTARNQCSALTVRGRHAVIQERESEGDGPPVLQVLSEGKSVRELLHQAHTSLLSGGRLRLRCPLRQGRPRRRGRGGPHPRTPGRGIEPAAHRLAPERSLKFLHRCARADCRPQDPPPCPGGVRSRLPTARRRLHFGRFPPLVVLALRVRGLWLIEERLPHDTRRKRNEVWVLHERPDPLCTLGNRFATIST